MYLVVQAWSSSEGGSFGDAKNWKSKNIPKKNDVVVITGDTDDLIKMEKPCVHACGNTHAYTSNVERTTRVHNRQLAGGANLYATINIEHTHANVFIARAGHRLVTWL